MPFETFSLDSVVKRRAMQRHRRRGCGHVRLCEMNLARLGGGDGDERQLAHRRESRRLLCSWNTMGSVVAHRDPSVRPTFLWRHQQSGVHGLSSKWQSGVHGLLSRLSKNDVVSVDEPKAKRPKFAAQTWGICPRFARFGLLFCLFQTGTAGSVVQLCQCPTSARARALATPRACRPCAGLRERSQAAHGSCTTPATPCGSSA